MNLIEKYFGLFCIYLLPVLYLVFATSFYFVFYVWKSKEYKERKIQAPEVATYQFRRELVFSIISLMIFAGMGFLVFVLQKKGIGNIYFNISQFGFAYMFLSAVLMILFHDMYFYWTHRLLHLPGWYEKVHIVHHLSTNPSPFTSLAFHPVEAVIQAAVLPLMVIAIPSHPFSLMFFLLYMVYKNVRGHAGYEFTSPTYRQNKWNSFQSFSIHHNSHHLHGKDNYGLYFTLWDRLMKTFRDEQ